jgi:type VI secretion system protein ImpF
MSRVDPNQGLTPSVLDRLIDPDSGGTAWRRGYGVDQMIAAVHRDLEELLNTRQSHAGLPEAFTEVHNSIVAYGLPDLTSLKAASNEERSAIGRVIEDIITRFEPRLRDIRATLVDDGKGKERTVRFRVDARLCLDPSPDVAFDTLVELTTGHASVKPSDG